MPEKPEVITIAKRLEEKLINKTINDVNIIYPKIVEYPSVEEYKKEIKNQTIHEITTRGKWIVMSLDKDLLLFHLRMEGKLFFRTKEQEVTKHEHVIFDLGDIELRFQDVRKFGRTLLIPKEKCEEMKPFSELGKEPWDKTLTTNYLKEKFKNKSLPVKSLLLDQSIITGIGNIYADEILFLSNIYPIKKGKELTEDDLQKIIENTKKVLDSAIKQGGTTIRSYVQEEGVKGNFQNNLNVHQRENEKCYKCSSIIVRERVNGRSTYFCPKCQK